MQTQTTTQPVKKSPVIKRIPFSDDNHIHRITYHSSKPVIRLEVARMTARQADEWLKQVGFNA